jgi:hypothetical protein
MTETTTKAIKIIGTIIALIGLWWIILASWETKTGEAQAIVKELIQLKDQKEDCKNNLSYNDTIEDYKWFSKCWDNDERIKELKEQLQEKLLNDYEQVDAKIMEKQLQMIADAETWKAEKLTAFIMSE